MLVNKAENRLEQLQARINAAVEEIASAPEK